MLRPAGRGHRARDQIAEAARKCSRSRCGRIAGFEGVVVIELHPHTPFASPLAGRPANEVSREGREPGKSLLNVKLPASPTLRPQGGQGEDELRQPSLPPLVMLAIAERLALALGDAEVEFLDVLVLGAATSRRRPSPRGRSPECSRSAHISAPCWCSARRAETTRSPSRSGRSRSRKSLRRSAAPAPSTARRAGSSSAATSARGRSRTSAARRPRYSRPSKSRRSRSRGK